jgi:DNA-binding transcriptional MerR regulator
MTMQLARKRTFAATPTIPDRLYFKIGDVARICGVETYVLRFWESQFPQLKPNKSGTGQRLYRRREVELAVEIKRLVHAQGYTLAGARQALEDSRRAEPNRTEPQPLEAPRIEAAKLDAPKSEAPKLALATPQREAQAEPQSRLPLIAASPIARPDAVAALIHHARVELREIATILAAPVLQQTRRRPRLAALSKSSGSLFPS